MPLYSYTCRKCDTAFETLVTGQWTPVCPKCGGEDLERRLSATAEEGKSGKVKASWRARAAREGHLSSFKS